MDSDKRMLRADKLYLLFPDWCGRRGGGGRGCCLVAVTIFVNLSSQPVLFLLWILMTLKMYLEFEENLFFVNS